MSEKPADLCEHDQAGYVRAATEDAGDVWMCPVCGETMSVSVA